MYKAGTQITHIFGALPDGMAAQTATGFAHKVDELVLGVQRNLCVSAFRKENGATKLGSHTRGEGPR
ncbi:hypothetical protein KFU94_39785 [Chloroflexi bacterium TSY]|nr:hypothetical protein [Chloroflexi bacterium TSY]